MEAQAKLGLARLRTTPRRAPGVVATPPWGGGEERPAPYTGPEVERLVELVAERPGLLLGPGDSSSRRAGWDELARKMSRTSDDVRRKWATIITELRLPKRTSPFKPYELTALRLIGAERPRSPQLQIIPTSVCSIPANSFLDQSHAPTPTPAPAKSPVAPLTIVALSNRQVSITPVKRPAPPDNDESELQLVRVSQSVHTQTVGGETPGEPAKRARLDEAALCARLVSLEERRLALDRERLSLDRDKLKCLQELVALLRAGAPKPPTANGELLAKTLASSF